MNFRYKKEVSIISLALVLVIGTFTFIKTFYFSDVDIDAPLKVIMRKTNVDKNEVKFAKATTLPTTTTGNFLTTTASNLDEDLEGDYVSEGKLEYPYQVAPQIVDDGSIIYDGMTITELTNKLNKSLNSYLTNTGYFFAKFTRDTGMDPYLSVAIVLLETGCKWTCSSLTVKCNNIGGLKGGPSCNGGAYKKYNTLEEGIEGYLNILYNNYYLKGLTDQYKMASTYAASDQWAQKVTSYINEIKAK